MRIVVGKSSMELCSIESQQMHAQTEMIPVSHQQKQRTIDHPARPESSQ